MIGSGLTPMLEGMALPLKTHVRSLGVFVDPSLLLTVQVMAAARSSCYQLRLIRQLHHFLEENNLAMFIMSWSHPDPIIVNVNGKRQLKELLSRERR